LKEISCEQYEQSGAVPTQRTKAKVIDKLGI